VKKPPVAWGRPAKDLRGKLRYKSKCGRFEIEKRHFASGRSGYFNEATTKRKTVDTLAEAKMLANWEIDPNWEP
jgi:hypothetical protein